MVLLTLLISSLTLLFVFFGGRCIMTTQAQLSTKLDEQSAKLQKVGNESAKSVPLIEELKAQLASASDVTPQLQEAFDRLEAQVKSVDDLVPDAETPPVDGETTA